MVDVYLIGPMQTLVAAYTKSMGTVSRYCERMRERCFRSNRVVPKPGFNSA